MMIDIHLLKVFVAVYKNKSVTKAAEELFLSQPTISEHIKTLEKFLSCTLFDRVNKKLFPTHYADRLYEQSIGIIEQAEGLKHSIIEAGEDFTGALTVGASSIPAAYLVPNAIKKMRKEYRQLKFDIVSMDSRLVIEDVLSHNLLLGLSGTKISDSSLDFQPFAKDRLELIASPDLVKKDRLRIDDIIEMPIILREAGSGTLKELLNFFEQKGISRDELNVVATFGSNEAVKEAVIKGIGISFVSSFSIKKELNCKILKTVSLENINIERYFYIVKHKKRTLPPVYELFIKALTSSFV
ncbi:MAG: selenium metabolism-associated LysR family transcriptional regulator [bacterium]